jgi:hypothetical protein
MSGRRRMMHTSGGGFFLWTRWTGTTGSFSSSCRRRFSSDGRLTVKSFEFFETRTFVIVVAFVARAAVLTRIRSTFQDDLFASISGVSWRTRTRTVVVVLVESRRVGSKRNGVAIFGIVRSSIQTVGLTRSFRGEAVMGVAVAVADQGCVQSRRVFGIDATVVGTVAITLEIVSFGKGQVELGVSFVTETRRAASRRIAIDATSVNVTQIKRRRR